MASNGEFSVSEINTLSRRPLSWLLSEIEADKANLTNPANRTNQINLALAACSRACEEALGLIPFDEQIIASYTMCKGKIIQMATGEGKTISAVFAAYLLTLRGHKVHILTFNDYLAKRDYDWMKPIYDKLSVDLGYITADVSLNDRKKAYEKSVVYSTAKECGFDYLRDFIADSESDILLGKPDAVIVDEADSIMIDEARIPLVIAGTFKNEQKKNLPLIMEFVRTLGADDFKIYEDNKSVYLTDNGLQKAERFFNADNIYSEEFSDTMTMLYGCLKAEFYLKEDKDYLVRNGKIVIVDEFTGRAVENRHYPAVLQSAVETKHGLEISGHGTVLGTIPLQYFIRQYAFIAGMTGTAVSSAEEFELLFGLLTVNIPTHLPVARIDHPPEIYYNNEIKWNAVVDAVLTAHEKGQPILIGTSSIEESISLAKRLSEHNITAEVLNAKNDYQEAEIIKNAGGLGAVTISTNMAGRGVDILLGGSAADGSESSKDAVIRAGGLLVIITAMHESARINDQLRGRAGRQGDIGESRVFISLSDDIMNRYELKKLIPKSRYPSFTTEKITDKTVLREVSRIQRISEGDMLDCRKDLLKYTAITEKHRNAIFTTRARYVRGEAAPNIWCEYGGADYEKAVMLHGESALSNMEKKLILSVINDVWSEYLEFTDEIRSGIHLTSVGGKSPVEEFNIAVEEYYLGMEQQVRDAMLMHLEGILAVDSIDAYKIKKPIEIWTYLRDERIENLVKKPFLTNVLTDADEEEKQETVDKKEGEQLEKKTSFFSRLLNRK